MQSIWIDTQHKVRKYCCKIDHQGQCNTMIRTSLFAWMRMLLMLDPLTTVQSVDHSFSWLQVSITWLPCCKKMHDMQTHSKGLQNAPPSCRGRCHLPRSGHQTRHWPWNFVVVVFFQICSRASSSGVAIHITPLASILADMHDNIIHVNEDEGYIVGGSANPILIDSHNLGDIGICQKPNLRIPIVAL